MLERRARASLFDPERRRGLDRRDSPRYRTGDLVIRMVWELGGQRREARAALCNVARGGLCLLVSEAPPRGVKVDVRLEAHPTAAVSGMVAHVKNTRYFFGGPVLVGLRLDADCPYDFFSAAVNSL